jgi:hypothetical protein
VLEEAIRNDEIKRFRRLGPQPVAFVDDSKRREIVAVDLRVTR